MSNDLERAFKRIKQRHRDAIRLRVARAVLGSSVIRVFTKNTKPALYEALLKVPVDELATISETRFSTWYKKQLDRLESVVRKRNSKNPRVLPGIKWGHSGKVLSLFLRDLVMHTRYFDDRDARRIEKWLYVPVDSFVIKRLRKVAVELPFRQIREIDTAKKFYMVQDLLASAAASSQVPRVWFDDNWADRG